MKLPMRLALARLSLVIGASRTVAEALHPMKACPGRMGLEGTSRVARPLSTTRSNEAAARLAKAVLESCKQVADTGC